MNIIFEHLIIFLQISLLCLFLTISGFLLKKAVLNIDDNTNYEENGIFGFIFIGFISLVINFLYPLTIYVNNALFIIIIIFSYKFKFFNQSYKKLIKYTFFTSLICYILFIYSNVNTPDALLYHLPFSKIINEHKIIVGLSNIHSRFGHISIFQYISSFFNNSFLGTNGILIPIGLLVSYFFIYCFKQFRNDFKKEESRIKSYFVFFILVFSLYSFNRYSGYGNDAQVHIYYFLTIIYLLDFFIINKSLHTFRKLSLVCLFTFLIKPFYAMTLVIPFLIFIMIRKNFVILRSKFFFFGLFFVFFWLLKNLLISGCLIYPVNATCGSNLIWYSDDTIKNSIAGEAWSKDWPNRIQKDTTAKDFNKNFNWVSSWSKTHLLVIIEKLLPIFVFILINILFLFFTKCLKKNKYERKNNFFHYALLINVFLLILWFIKFPIYRYGLSFIYIFLITLLYFIFIRYIDLDKLKNYYKVFVIFIFLIFFGAITKNLFRISDDYKQSISPSLYDQYDVGRYERVYNKDNIFTHYHKDTACGYSLSPCTNYKTELYKKQYFNYQIYYK
tara:strand:- start:186 stop:1859 length:1674 start_codon:yes stop_codon:yes gene_type:complete